jgi:hypothetical protein
VSDAFVYTTMLWALVMGWSGARVVYYLMCRREYGYPGRSRTKLGGVHGARSQRTGPARDTGKGYQTERDISS